MTAGVGDTYFAGDLVPGREVFGQQVDLYVTPVDPEIERRASVGIGAVTDVDILRLLMGLPAHESVPSSILDPLGRFVLSHAPQGVVEITGDVVTRRLVAPLQIEGIVKRASSWADIEAATLLRTHAPCVVVAPGRLARRALVEAPQHLGVARMDRDAPVTERLPSARWVRPSWQRWTTAELAFETRLHRALPVEAPS